MPTTRRRQSVPTMKSITRRRTSGNGLAATPRRRFVNPMDQFSKMPGTAVRGRMEPQPNRNMVGAERDLRQAANIRPPIVPGPRPFPGNTPPAPDLNRVDPDTLAPGRTPLDHQRYWANQGYLYRPNEARPENDWIYRADALQRYMAQFPPPIGNPGGGSFPGPRPNPGQMPPTTPPIYTSPTMPNTGAGNTGAPGAPPGSVTPDPGTSAGGPNSGAGPVGPPTPNPGGGLPPGGNSGAGTPPPGGNSGGNPPVPGAPPIEGLPLDAYFEAQRRQYDDALARQLAALDPMQAQIMALQAQQEARLGTNETLQKRSMLESLAGRGAFGGGIQLRDEGNLATDFMRQRQDVATGTAGQLSDIALQRSGAYGDYNNQIAEAMMALAQRQAESEYAPTPTPRTDPRVRDTPPKMPNRPKNRRKPSKKNPKKNRRRG